ncbi:DUF6264 family protein [Microbacterium sp. AZCO]|uniref:DUF6264 family protein n=1 Tax=Microbacterium sp. AZCO TaxID=3142976 RepID=UPI0031F3FC84
MSDADRPRPEYGERPRPAYGEYATPEEQRARIQQPDATWAIETGQAPSETGATTPAPAPAPAWGPPPPSPRAMRNTDRTVTLILLVVGAFNVAVTAFSYFDLASLADQAMKILGIPGEFTNTEAAALWGPIAAGVLIIGYLLTAFLSWLSLRAHRVSWWIPLVGAVVTYIGVYVCLSVPLLGDPAFTDFVTTRG